MPGMLRNFLLVLLVIAQITACSQCNILKGRYRSAGGSEQNTTLELSANDKFLLVYENWEPGNYENRKISKINGIWSCKDNQLILDMDSEKITAVQITVGQNPLGLNEDTKALHFKGVSVDNFLNNEILYATK